ncbi:MAG: branched-chain amino acid transport system ATP-binding protein [Desulfobacteraceae bacterium Eth-SRB1]|nr:MAG: branched-chain amino acid transport system ATP-binding protein [Desulfobacteraceae bacterium Eth-SRB1]
MNVQRKKTTAKFPLLKIESVYKAFGGVQALLDVSFDVEKGFIVGLIGPNGAGKTTLFNLIAGVYSPGRGRIIFDRADINKKKIYELVTCGISRTFQNVELFESMTVIENVMVGQHVITKCGFLGAISSLPWILKEERKAKEEAMELLAFVGLDKYADKKSSDLPFGWQRLLEIARALASKPKLLLLDEPAAGLNAVETRQLGELLKKILNRGVTMILVEHDMSLTMEISDKIVVLDQGEILAVGTPREIQSNEAVMTAYLGK